MNSEIENEEMVQINFRVYGYRNYTVPKKDWEKKWKDKIVNPVDFYELDKSISELVSERSTGFGDDEERVEFDHLSPA